MVCWPMGVLRARACKAFVLGFACKARPDAFAILLRPGTFPPFHEREAPGRAEPERFCLPPMRPYAETVTTGGGLGRDRADFQRRKGRSPSATRCFVRASIPGVGAHRASGP